MRKEMADDTSYWTLGGLDAADGPPSPADPTNGEWPPCGDHSSK
jgi:hypothetical protein